MPEHGPKEHAAEGLPAKSVTVWTAKSELFMEYEPLVVGHDSKLAAHVTELSTFKPVSAGELDLVVEQADGTRLTARAPAPASPGIFRATLRPSKPGKCSWSISIGGSQVQDRIDAGPCEVLGDEKAALAAAGQQPERGGIGFAKEQQWKTDFATVVASERELQETVHANAEITPVAGKEARLTAPTTGRVSLASPAPVIGMAVKQGQVLAVISPRLDAADRASLSGEVQAARAEVEAARLQLARAERLWNEQAIPARQLDDAKTRMEVARARLGAAEGRLAQFSSGASGFAGARHTAFQIRAPLDGTLVLANATSGESVQEGKLLFSVIDLGRVWLQARVFEPDIPKLEGARSAWFTVEGYPQPFEVNEKNGKLVTIGRVLDPQSRTVPLIFELTNPQGRLRIGQFAKVFVATGASVRALAVPETAIVDQGGKPVVFVQVDGERFERRPLLAGERALGWVAVRDGLASGERVVTRGAYELKLAAAAGGIPQHGHVH